MVQNNELKLLVLSNQQFKTKTYFIFYHMRKKTSHKSSYLKGWDLQIFVIFYLKMTVDTTTTTLDQVIDYLTNSPTD